MEALQRVQLNQLFDNFNPLFDDSHFESLLKLTIILYGATLFRNFACKNEPALKANFLAMEQIQSLAAFRECRKWTPLRNGVCDRHYFIHLRHPEGETCAEMLRTRMLETERVALDWHSKELCDPKSNGFFETASLVNTFALIFEYPLVDVLHL